MRTEELKKTLEQLKHYKGEGSNLLTFNFNPEETERTFYSEEPAILFLLAGSLHYQIGDDEPRRLKQNEYLFYPKGITIHLEEEKGSSYFHFPLKKDFIEQFIILLEKYRNFPPSLLETHNRVCIMQNHLNETIEYLLVEIASQFLAENDYFIHLHLCELLYYIFPNEHMLSKISYILDMYYYPESLRLVEGFLLENYYHPIRVKQMTDIANVSESNLNRLYKKYMGVSAMERLAAIRMEQAALLLRNQSYTITDVAAQVGYQSMSAFVQQFKRKFGVSPKDYRMNPM